MSDKDNIVKIICENDLPELKRSLSRVSNVGEANYEIKVDLQRNSNDRNNGRRGGETEDENIPYNGLTLLHVAAFYDSLECFRYLAIERKLGLARPSTRSFLPLHYACWAGSYEVALYILSKEPAQAIMHPDGTGDLQLLYCATIGCDSEILEALFDNGAKISDPWNNEKKLIEKGIGLHNRKILTLLLQHAPQHGRDTSQMTTAMRAVVCHNADALDAVFRGKEDLRAHYTDKTGYHSLISLICEIDLNKSFKIVFMKVLESARDVKIEPPSNGLELYQAGVCHWACQYMDIDIARLMFQTQGVLPNRFDREYKTGPTRLIEKKNGKDIIKMLEFVISQGFDVNIRYSDSKPTLLESFITAIMPNYEAIEFLINTGANPHVKHSKNNQTLYEFVKSRRDTKMKKAFQIPLH